MKKTHLASQNVLQQTVFYTVLFSLLAHGYRFLNMSFSGDAAQISQAEEIAYQISIGRFMQPVLWMIRGHITAPLTIGLFATAALVGAAVMIVSMLGITSQLSIALVCGILATNETLSVSYATYLPWVDVYMFALLFAVAGVYCHYRFQHGWLISPFFYMLSLALYQSYLQTAVVLIIIILVLNLLNNETAYSIWCEGIKSCLALLAGLILYAIGNKLSLALMQIEARNDYNTVAFVGIIDYRNLPNLIRNTYLFPFQFFMRDSDSSFVPPILTLLLLVVTLPVFLMCSKKLSSGRIATLLFLFAILPFGVNFVSLIAKGLIHTLMTYALFFLYVFCIVLFEHKSHVRPYLWLSHMQKTISYLLISVAILTNILSSNQLYLRRDLEFYSTTSAATRILKHADSIEGYIPGETPVCVLGYLPSSKISLVRPGFESLSNLQGMRYTYAASYETATPWYFQMVLGYPVNFVTTDERNEYQRSGIGDSIPNFPDKNCYQMIDGTLFIKLS